MLSVTQFKSYPAASHQQCQLCWKSENFIYEKKCYLNLWVGGCCGFNVLSYMEDLCSLSKEEFSKFMGELSKVFKERLFGGFFGEGAGPPYYRVNQVFFLYGDTPNQRDAYKNLISIGKEVHRYVSGSQPNHDTVMISIDL